jgi:transcription elongation factor GreB
MPYFFQTMSEGSSRKNYITPKGFTKLKDELHVLLTKTRPDLTQVVAWAASNGDRSENADYIYGKKRLREIDRRIRFLSKRLEIAEVVDPLSLKSEQVAFGATVVYENEDGATKTVSIVGIDETDPARGRISWISPLANALLGRKKGDVVVLRSPKGEEDLEILDLRYEELS